MKSYKPLSKKHIQGEEWPPFNQKLEDHPDLLLLINIDKDKIFYINNTLLSFGFKPKDAYELNLNIYKKFIHPEDYPNFIIHLTSCKQLKDWEEKEIIVRANFEGEWKKFCFTNRRYLYTLSGGDCYILSQAHKIPKLSPRVMNDVALCDIKKNYKNPNSKYKQLLNSLDEAYCLVEVIFNQKGEPIDFLFTETNPAFENQVNLKNPEGKTMRELIPDHEDHWFKAMGNVALTGKSNRFKQYGEKLNKDWFELFAFRVGDENSRRVAVLFSKITEQKKAEEKLKKSKDNFEKQAVDTKKELLENNQLLQTVFDTSNLAIAVMRTIYHSNGDIEDFKFVRVNKMLQKMFVQDDVVGKTYKETTKLGIDLGIFEELKTVMLTGTMMDLEIFYDKQGYNNWFRITGNQQDDLLIIYIEDITSRKAASQKLKEVMRFNRQLVQTSPDTILIINLDEFKVRYINQDLLKRAGMTRKIILGMSLTEILPFIHPRDRENLIQFHKSILKSGDREIHELEFRIKTKDNPWEWFSARGKIFNRKDKIWVNEYVLLVKNITEQKNTQRALINAEKLSIQGEVARTFAHELRNPIASIRMTTDVIKNKLDEAQQKVLGNYLQILSRSTNVLNNLVSNLLNAANYTPVVLEKADLAEILELAIEKASDRIYLAGIKVLKQYNGPYFIMADQEKLCIAILNIIVNASEATKPDEGIIELLVKKHKTDFELNITDNGIGMEQEQIDQLFNAFYTNKKSGVGIGLSSVKNILDDHDAQIKVISKPDVGTTFKILFHNLEMK